MTNANLEALKPCLLAIPAADVRKTLDTSRHLPPGSSGPADPSPARWMYATGS